MPDEPEETDGTPAATETPLVAEVVEPVASEAPTPIADVADEIADSAGEPAADEAPRAPAETDTIAAPVDEPAPTTVTEPES